MDFKTASRLASYLSKEYAEDFFGLLVNYRDLSASEAASRLGLHIHTAQEFLEGLAALGILKKEEVYEKKRPYYRYTLTSPQIVFQLDLQQIKQAQASDALTRRVREKAYSGANFSLARGGQYISYVSLWTGEGRDRKERKISLTLPQGTFLFHLPFPNSEFASIAEIMHKAGLEESLAPEILDIVDVLEKHGVIETK
jgi:predicted transcriptional regulator